MCVCVCVRYATKRATRLGLRPRGVTETLTVRLSECEWLTEGRSFLARAAAGLSVCRCVVDERFPGGSSGNAE